MRRGGQGEALAVWAVWLLTLLAVVVTYSRIDAAELYNVEGNGLGLGLSRAAVHTNWPFALVAIVLVLVAMRDLPRRAWWLAGPAIALCATMPLFVSQSHLNARWQNLVPGVGVALALGLAVAAIRRAGASFQPRLPGDPVRIVLAVVVLVLSLPWIAAELGFHLPGDVFMGQELFRTRGRAPRGGGAPRRAPRVARLAAAALGARPLARAGSRPAPDLAPRRDGGARGLRRRQRHAGFLAGAARQARDGGLGDPERSLSRPQAGDARHRCCWPGSRPGC